MYGIADKRLIITVAPHYDVLKVKHMNAAAIDIKRIRIPIPQTLCNLYEQ